jgi:hypothetical protein
MAVFNSCLELQQEWVDGIKKEEFWHSVSKKVEASIGRSYAWGSCRRVVDAKVKQWQDYLKTVKTGKGHVQTAELDQAIDMWIVVLDDKALIKLASKASIEQRRMDLKVDNDFRLQMTERLGQTRRQESSTSQTSQQTGTTSTTGNIDANGDPERPRRRQRTTYSENDNTMTHAIVNLTNAMSESLVADSQSNRELSSTVESVERRLAVLETDFRASYKRTNELLEHIVSRLGSNH